MTMLRINKSRALFFLAFALIVMGRAVFFLTADNQQVQDDIKTQIVKDEIYEFTNEQRDENNKSNLLLNAKLTRAAQMKADDMAEKGYFSHTDPAGRKFTYWLKLAGYDYAYTAENLAVKFLNSESIVRAWMNSEAHRNSLISEKYSEFGVGIALGKYKGDQAFFVVMLLAEPTIPSEYHYLFQ